MAPLLLLLLAALLPSRARADAPAWQLTSCDAQALAQPAAAPALAAQASALVRACSGFSGYTFSARVLNPAGADVAVYLGVGAAQCGASCVRGRRGSCQW